MEGEEKHIRVPGKSNVKILKWKVKTGSKISKGILLGLYEAEDGPTAGKQQRLRSCDNGIVQSVEVEEGKTAAPNELLLKIKVCPKEPCSHPTIMKDMCAECGADLRREFGLPGDLKDSVKQVTASVAMVHSIPELRVSEQEALEIGKEDETRLLSNRKLVLLVDLDQTLIHTTNDNIPANLKDVFHFQLRHGPSLMWYHTKFRPNTANFLETVSKLFELHICTFGNRMYAHTIARFLDPDGRYFSHRILSRDECFDATTKTANLKSLFPCGDSMVCIIDDREDVWENCPNLIHVKPYRFFQGTADINAPPGLTKMENDNVPIFHHVLHSHQSNTANGTETKNSKTDPGPKKSLDKDPECSVDEVKQQDVIKSENKNTVSDATTLEMSLNNKTSVGDTENTNENDIDRKTVDNKLLHSENERKEMEMETGEGKITAAVEGRVNQISSEVEILKQGDEMEQDDEETESKFKSEKKGKYAEETNESKDKKNTEEHPEINKSADMDQNDEETKFKQDFEKEKCSVIAIELDKENQICDDIKTEQEEEAEKELDKKKETYSDNLTETNEDKEKSGKEEIEWEDEDDYLWHLEEILKRIHRAYYEIYDQMKTKRNQSTPLPCIKNVIPYVKRKVLKGVNIVFSGVVPLHKDPEKTRIYLVAKSLGANILMSLVPKTKNSKADATTHLVAAKLGTIKVKQAQKMKSVFIVNPDWLWCCNERWEKVDERLFPVGEPMEVNTKTKKDRTSVEQRKRKKPATDCEQNCKKIKKSKMEHSDDVIDIDVDDDNSKSGDDDEDDDDYKQDDEMSNVDENEYQESKSDQTADGKTSEENAASFAETYNPLFVFSDADIEFMDREVEEGMTGSDSSEDEEERNERVRKRVLGDVSDTSSDDSLAGDFPLGWKVKKPRSESPSGESEEESKEKDNTGYESENEVMLKYEGIVEAFAPHRSSESERSEDTIGSVDDEIADAVEKEFLGAL